MDEERNFRHRLEKLEEELGLLRAHWDEMQRAKHREVKQDKVANVSPPPLPVEENVSSPMGVVMQQAKRTTSREDELPVVRLVPDFEPVIVVPKVAVPEDAELRFGQTWAVRIGVVLLLTGFVFLGNYAWEHYISGLGALPRLMLLLLLALVATGAGEWVRRRPRLNVFGQVITAGGLAALFYCAFASHHISRLRVIDSPYVGALLLVATGMVILGYAAWRKSAVLCCAAVLMAFYGVVVQPIAHTAMVSSLVVSVMATTSCMKNGWRSVGLTGVISCYLAYVLWQGTVHEAAAFSSASWYLVAYWILFTVSILHPRAPWKVGEQFAVCAINHTALAALLSFDWRTWTWHEKTWLVHAVLAAAVFGLAFFLEKRRGRSLLSEAHLLQAFALGTLALLLRWPNETLPLAISIKGLVLMIWCRRDKRLVVECSAYGLMIFAISLAAESWGVMMPWRDHLPLAAIYFAALFVAPRSEDLRIMGRWILAVFGTIALNQAFGSMPQQTGILALGAVAMIVAMVHRCVKEKFPAPEMKHTLLVAIVLSSMVMILASLENMAPMWVFASCAAMLWLLANITNEIPFDAKSLDHKQAFPIMFALAFWIVFGSLFLQHLKPLTPLGSTALYAFAAMVLLQALAHLHRDGMVLRLTAPLFSLLVAVLALNGTPMEWLLTALAGLVYAAVLTTPRLKHHLFMVPVVLGAGLYASRIWNDGAWSAMAFFLVAAAIYLMKFLRAEKIWRIVSWSLLALSFMQFVLFDPSHKIVTYLLPLCLFALLIARSRYWRKPSTFASKWVAIILASVVAVHLSAWANANGPPHALTVLWAILGGVYFLLGFAMRERVMRVLMLILLLCSMGKIFVSVWELGTLMRIASFLVSGGVFLGLGYVYNKHPEWFGTKSPENVPAPESNET